MALKVKKRILKTDRCPNCNQSLEGENYCPNCGQKNDIRRLNLYHFISESLSNLFAIDGRLLHTLTKLFRSPGKVPLNYIRGQRMQYMHPVRLYFLSSLLLLFVLQFNGKSENLVRINNQPAGGSPLDSIVQAEPEVADLLSQIKKDQGNLAEEPKTTNELGKVRRMVAYFMQNPKQPVDDALAAMNLQANFWNRFVYTYSTKLAVLDDEQFSRYFYSKLFWVLFLFLPFLAAILNLLYRRPKYFYPEHLFFTFYTQSVFFILLSIGSFMAWVFYIPAIPLIFVLLFVVYLFLAIRHFYGKSSGTGIWKFILLNTMVIPLFTVFFILAALITFIFF